MKRRTAREIILKCLFSLEFTPANPEEGVENVISEHVVDEPNLNFIHDAVRGVCEKKDKLDSAISRYAQQSDWSVDRIALVDKNILRLALYEIQFSGDVPVSVAINEAVELAKLFSSEESGKFINGILGHFVRENISVETTPKP